MKGLNSKILKGSISITALVLGVKVLQHNDATTDMVLIAKENPDTAKYKLQHVQLVFRHGARTPVCTYDIPCVEAAVWDPKKFSGNLPHTDVECDIKLISDGKQVSIKDIDPSNYSKEFLKGGMRKGKLTKNGQQLAYLAGQCLREEYITNKQFISSIYDKDQVRIRTSSFQRTVDTAKSLLAGMYNKSNIQEPIEMWTVLPHDEYLYPNFYNCHNLYTWYKGVRSNFLNMTEETKEDTLKINRKLGLHKPDELIDAFHLLDLIHTREAHGFKGIPDCLTEEDRQLITETAAKIFSHGIQGQNDERLLSLSTGALLEDICSNIEQKISRERPFKMELFSAHDTTLMGLLMVTGKWENQWPTYVTMFKVELFKDENSDYHVRIEYNGGPLYLENNGKEIIPIKTFFDIVGRYRVKDYNKECSVKGK